MDGLTLVSCDLPIPVLESQWSMACAIYFQRKRAWSRSLKQGWGICDPPDIVGLQHSSSWLPAVLTGTGMWDTLLFESTILCKNPRNLKLLVNWSVMCSPLSNILFCIRLCRTIKNTGLDGTRSQFKEPQRGVRGQVGTLSCVAEEQKPKAEREK